MVETGAYETYKQYHITAIMVRYRCRLTIRMTGMTALQNLSTLT